jgi:hypothetical protein
MVEYNLRGNRQFASYQSIRWRFIVRLYSPAQDSTAASRGPGPGIVPCGGLGVAYAIDKTMEVAAHAAR